ncbi:hypothetical protein J6590_003818 [Homalodisca vitripennis]|nr:hypothetical protein J6590_003818 [Homalodisca vitripennis]
MDRPTQGARAWGQRLRVEQTAVTGVIGVSVVRGWTDAEIHTLGLSPSREPHIWEDVPEQLLQSRVSPLPVSASADCEKIDVLIQDMFLSISTRDSS